MQNLCQNVWVFNNSIQYSDFTEDTHNTLIEQSKHKASPQLDLYFV